MSEQAGAGTSVPVGTIRVADLVDICEHMAAINRELFERLGGWVADEPEPAFQQWFAVACHRHAWHADLWNERRPEVPIAPTPAAATAERSEPDDRAGWYADQLAALQRDLAAIDARVDPVLDPSTTRVIHLVAADLADLAARAPTR